MLRPPVIMTSDAKQMGPPPTDVFYLLHWNMINAHNVFKLGHQCIVNRLDDPPLNDLYNFLGYCEAWVLVTRGYYYTQSKVAYPLLTKRMIFPGADEHQSLANKLLQEILATIQLARDNNSQFDAKQLKSQLATISDSVFPKLDTEVDQMTGEKLKEAGFTEGQMLELLDGLKTCRESAADPLVMVPFVTSHVPPETKPYWPAFPWIFRVLLIPYVFSLRHYGYWKYAPYSA